MELSAQWLIYLETNMEALCHVKVGNEARGLKNEGTEGGIRDHGSS